MRRAFSTLLIEKGFRPRESSPEKAGVGGSTPSLATIIISDLANQPEISHLVLQ
jgi:hypothetical protein